MQLKKQSPFPLLTLLGLVTIFPVYAELPKTVQIDMHRIALIQAMQDKDCKKILQHVDKLQQLNSKTVESFTLLKAQCNHKMGEYDKSMQLLETLLTKIDRDNKDYNMALDLFARVEHKIEEQKISDAQTKLQREHQTTTAATQTTQPIVQKTSSSCRLTWGNGANWRKTTACTPRECDRCLTPTRVHELIASSYEIVSALLTNPPIGVDPGHVACISVSDEKACASVVGND